MNDIYNIVIYINIFNNICHNIDDDILVSTKCLILCLNLFLFLKKVQYYVAGRQKDNFPAKLFGFNRLV